MALSQVPASGPSPPRARTEVLAFYRADPWPALLRILAIGPPSLALGALVVFFSLVTHAPLGGRVAAAAAGFALVAGGALFTMIAMHSQLRREVCVAIRTDGVHVQTAHDEALLPWDALTRARWDAQGGFIVLEQAAGPRLILGDRYAGIAGPALAALVERARHRAALGFLR